MLEVVAAALGVGAIAVAAVSIAIGSACFRLRGERDHLRHRVMDLERERMLVWYPPGKVLVADDGTMWRVCEDQPGGVIRKISQC